MLIAILALYIAHYRVTGVYTFEYAELLGTPLSPLASMCIMLGFFAAFAVKLPIFPFHTWLPDACAEASTGTNMILAGLLATTAGYGMIRFLFPLFPDAARTFAPIAMILAVIGIIYGAFLALSQTNLMRLLAYASISHLGFVLLGIFASNALSVQGAVMTMIAHGVSTGALFLVAGRLKRAQDHANSTPWAAFGTPCRDSAESVSSSRSPRSVCPEWGTSSANFSCFSARSADI